ncbi:pyruvate kinase [Litorivicinus sp.]|nr:pyruvate kinase [Litorivicinus sp.]
MRRTKIVATLGPASDRPTVLRRMIEGGVNVFRLNFSHGEGDDHRRRANEVRKIAKELNATVAVLADLQGPKIRIACFRDEFVNLKKGASFALDSSVDKNDGDVDRVGLDYPELSKDCSNGDFLLLDDGHIVLEVIQVFSTGRVCTEVVQGGKLSNNKGINKLGGGLSAPALTEKDYADMDIISEIDADYVAISFPRDARDMQLARKALKQRGSDAFLMAKIERAEAVATDIGLDGLILASDAVMVARGDLGVEIGDDGLIGVQKKIIARSRALDRPVVTATQMMESMISSSMPTRAEIFDVANAVLDGTDAVMLSAETAIGDYPVEVVLAMAKTAEGAELTDEAQALGARVDAEYGRRDEAIALGAMYIAGHLKNLSAIICITESGSTPLWMSRSGSRLPIIAWSNQPKTLSKMALFRGVSPLRFDPPPSQSMSYVDKLVVRIVSSHLKLPNDSQVILTRGDRLNMPGGTSTLKIMVVGDAENAAESTS